MKKIGMFFLLAAVAITIGCSWSGSSQGSGILAAPTNLTANQGDTQVALSWTAVTNATSYNVYYGTSSALSTGTGTKVAVPTGNTATVTGLTNGTPYYFVVTAVNGASESGPSNLASATPAKGLVIQLTSTGANPSTPVPAGTNTSLTFTFPPGSVNAGQTYTVSIFPVTQGSLPVQFSRKTRANGRNAQSTSTSGDVFLAAFEVTVNPTTLTVFNVPVGVGGSVDPTTPVGATVNLAMLVGNTWVDVATFVVGANGAIAENLPSVSLPGLLKPGYYLLYEPAKGSNTSVSNLGIALLADDGYGMADGAGGLQVMHLYDSSGNLLNPPTIAYLDYSNAYDLDGQALTPDGSQGIMVDGGNTVRFFSKAQTGVPIASTTTVDISAYGGDGDSIAILPNGDEAVVSGDSYSELVVISGILSGNPVAAITIPTPSYRDGLVISNDGTVLLARGSSGLTVYSVASITPVAGTIAGTITHSFTQKTDIPSCELTHYQNPVALATLAAAYAETGRFPEALTFAERAQELARLSARAASPPVRDDRGLPRRPRLPRRLTMRR